MAKATPTRRFSKRSAAKASRAGAGDTGGASAAGNRRGGRGAGCSGAGRSGAGRSGAGQLAGGPSYWTASRQPLQILAFLLPLIVAYELCLALVLRSESGVLTNKAHEKLLQVLVSLGLSPTGGLYLGGIAIVVVLLVWHVLARDRWTVDLRVLTFMAIEALIWTIPLILVRDQIESLFASGPPSPPAAFRLTEPELANLSTTALIAISVGAGLYEELVFRMLVIAVAHTLLVDVARLAHRAGAAIAILISAVLFTVYHPLEINGAVSARRVLFFLIAGAYFGGLYVGRGFGIVVAVHALYDVATVLAD